jgi:hypothetical protein
MAGTDDDNITSGWPWFTSAIEFVARRTNVSCDTAREFLLARLSRKQIRHRNDHLDFGRDGLAFPEEYFFLRTPAVDHEVDPDNTVIRTGPAIIQARSDGELKAKHAGEKDWILVKPTHVGREPGWRFDPNRKVTTRMPLVRLCMEDILRCLRAAGYVLPSGDPAQAELPLPPASEAEATTPKPGRLQELLCTGQLRGPQMEKIAADLPELFPPDGCIPATLTAAGLETLVIDLWRGRAAEKKKKLSVLPRIWHTCDRLLTRYRQPT